MYILYYPMVMSSIIIACCLKLEARFRLAPCYLKTRLDRITAQVWSSCRPKPGSFNRALRPRRFILVSACNFSADQPATRPEILWRGLYVLLCHIRSRLKFVAVMLSQHLRDCQNSPPL